MKAKMTVFTHSGTGSESFYVMLNSELQGSAMSAAQIVDAIVTARTRPDQQQAKFSQAIKMIMMVAGNLTTQHLVLEKSFGKGVLLGLNGTNQGWRVVVFNPDTANALTTGTIVDILMEYHGVWLDDI